jgi:ABC-type glutathione transport system ATPase component
VRLEVRDLGVWFGERQVVAVDALDLDQGQTLGIVGETGSGKSMTAYAIAGLAPGMGARVEGSVKLDGRELIGLSDGALRDIRGRRIAMIFQAPIASLNPVFPVGDVFLRALRLHGASRAEARERASAAMRSVALSPDLLRRYPHQLSGGQAQRVAIALAVALRAEVLIADEPTSALDVTVQAEILEVLQTLRTEESMATLFISHDLAVVSGICDTVAIMNDGKVVERGPVSETLRHPSHPYTRELLAAVPRLRDPGAADA